MGVKIGNLVFSSGIMGQDPQTHRLPAEPARQAELMFQHIRALLEQAGGTVDDIAQMTVFIKDDAYRDCFNREWLRMFPNERDRPARHTLLWDLKGGMLMQCELTAVLELDSK